MKRIIAATTLATAAWTTPVIAKECYAPDARAQEGKVLNLLGI
jgi:hypothetical protein